MRKYLFPALAMGLVLTSCQSDEPFAPGSGEEVQASFTISVPEAMGTRAEDHSSAEGGFANGAGNLNYTVALLNQDNYVMYSETCQSDGKTATFHPTVVQGYTYKVVAYATFGDAVAKSAINEAFDGNDALASIATLKGISDESEDAYYCFDTEVMGGAEMSATLRRPFGKLRLVATDYDKLVALGQDVKSVKVTYGENVVMETHFNAMAEVFGGQATSKEFEANRATYKEAATKELTVFTDYLPASKTGETMYPFTIVTTYTNGETYTRTFSQDIPVKRNYLTTLRGDFFTTEAALTLNVEEMFATPGIDRNIWDGVTTTEPEYDNTTNTYTVSTGAELAWLAEAVNNGITPNQAPNTRATNNYNFVLTSDIDLGGYQWTPIGTSAKPYTGVFDGNGHTISNLVVNGGTNSYIGLFGNTYDGEIKNLTVENAKVSGRLNVGVVAGQPYTSKYTNITVKGHVEVNGMAYVGAVGGKNAYADWTNITVNVDETSYVKAHSIENGTAYRTYVGGVVGFNGEGGHTFKNITSNIDVKGSTIDVGGLFGIAHYGNKFENCVCTGDVEIYAAAAEEDAQEIGGIAGVWHNQTGYTVEFTNCLFTGTLETNIEGVDLSGKTLVGAPYSATYTGKLIIDGATAVATAEQLAEAVKNGVTNLYLLDGEYNVANCGGKILTLSGSINAVLKVMNEGEDGCDYGFDSSTVTFNGLTINTTANNGNYKGYTRLTATYNDCNFVGAYTSHIVQTFNNCTFDFKNGYFWIWGAKEVNFNGCTFNGNSKNILAHGWESSVININDCAFAATEKGYTGAGDNTACVEIDPAGSNVYTINFTGNNTKTDSYNGWTRVKDNSTGHTITGLN